MTATGGHHERGGAGAIDFVLKVDEADLIFKAGLDQHGTGTIAKENAGRAIGVVDHRAHYVGPDDQHLAVSAGFDKFGTDLQGVDEAGAGGGEVKAPGLGGAEFSLHEAGGGGKEHVRRDGGDDDRVDFPGRNAGVLQAAPGGFGGKVAGGGALGRNVPLPYARAFQDPLVGCFHHAFQIRVGQQPRRCVGTEGGDFGATCKLWLDIELGGGTQTGDFLLRRNGATSSILPRHTRGEVGSGLQEPTLPG